MCFQNEEVNPWEPQVNLINRQYWLNKHQSFLRETNERRNEIRVVFIGDSIIEYWLSEGRHIWGQYYDPKEAVNYGIGGDTIQNVLWRVENGEVDGLEPRVVVIHCGTNNIEPSGRPSEEDIARGISQLISLLRQKLPNSKLILCSMFTGNHPLYQNKAKRINELIARNSDENNVFFLDLTPNMIDSNGVQKRGLFRDGLHLSSKGYDVWHQNMMPLFERLYN